MPVRVCLRHDLRSRSVLRAIALVEEVFDAQGLKLIWVDVGYRGKPFAYAVDIICGADVEAVPSSLSH
ncbi:hypothetical protein [Mastigocladopsis repens]|uniref:hypothetical protein n=1 Tax=Mastigocladopsis repens TaxID=221287 RepID=UPI0002F07A14|nr:hypothetical protein [Mastigocladopsis repens]